MNLPNNVRDRIKGLSTSEYEGSITIRFENGHTLTITEAEGVYVCAMNEGYNSLGDYHPGSSTQAQANDLIPIIDMVAHEPAKPSLG